MSTFSLAAMYLGGLPWLEVAKSMVMVTLGNMIGGVVFVALPYYLISKKTEA